jgi:hypothetical protein
MGIQKDAGELLIFIYNEYTSGNEYISDQNIIDTTKWEAGRINRAIKYLDDIGALKISSIGIKIGEYEFIIKGLKPLDIHMIEDKSIFKKTFGFEVGVPGLAKFSWSLAEK